MTPPLLFPPAQNFSCGSCTKCCRGWVVNVEPATYDKLRDSPLVATMRAEIGSEPIYAEGENARGESMLRTATRDGHCVFLAADKLCMVHRDVGMKAKPLGCRQFPFLLRDTPDGVVVGLSFNCTAVQANSGAPLETHAEELQGFLSEHRYPQVGYRPISLGLDCTISWDAYKRLEQAARDWLLPADVRVGAQNLFIGTIRLLAALHGRGAVHADAREVGSLLEQIRVREMPRDPQPRDPLMVEVERSFLVGILSALESQGAAAGKANATAINGGGILASDTLGKEVDLRHFQDFRTRFDAAWSLPIFHRYVDHLVFRKFLVQKKDVACSAAALYLVVPLLEWYRDLFAYAAGKLQPDPSDANSAFDVVERYFSLHSPLMDPFLEALVSAYLQLLG